MNEKKEGEVVTLQAFHRHGGKNRVPGENITVSEKQKEKLIKAKKI